MTAGLKFLKWRAASPRRWTSKCWHRSSVALSNGLCGLGEGGCDQFQQIQPSFQSTMLLLNEVSAAGCGQWDFRVLFCHYAFNLPCLLAREVEDL